MPSPLASICFRIVPLLLVLCLAGCGGGVRHRLPAIAPGTVILAFGDSITAGTGAARGHDYPALLADTLGCHVVNAGVPGELSSDGLLRLPSAIEAHAPAILVLCHGGNDLLRRLPEQGVAERIDAMVALSLARGIPVVLLAVPRPGLLMRPAPFYRRIARARGIVFVEDALREVLSDGRLKSDLVHPNERGHRVLADAVATAIRGL